MRRLTFALEARFDLKEIRAPAPGGGVVILRVLHGHCDEQANF